MKQPSRPWRDEEFTYLREAVAAGRSLRQMEQALGRSTGAISNALNRQGLSLREAKRQREGWTVHRLARTLSVDVRTVVRWITHYHWLEATHVSDDHWNIATDEVTRFLSDPQTWVAWRPEHIRDRELQAWAEGLRATASTFLDLRQAADLIGAHPQTLATWIRRAYVPAILYGNVYWLKQDVIDRLRAYLRSGKAVRHIPKEDESMTI